LAHGGGGGEGKASFNDFQLLPITSTRRRRSVGICAGGIKDATITVRKAGKGQQEF
jgi:hypothetical protein